MHTPSPSSHWRATVAALLLPLLLAACGRDTETPVRPLQAQPWTLPAPPGAAQPDLVRAPDGRLLLSWLEPAGDGHRLRLAGTRPGADWEPTRTIAEGSDWFVNWADTPHVYALGDGSLWAHWLRNTGPSRMDYGIALARSGDDGHSWTPAAAVHPGGSRGDHGFVSFWEQGQGQLGIAWLDSRQKAAAAGGGHDGHDGDGHHGGAAMMLRAAVHGADGAQLREWPLDASTCDCCPTAAARSGKGVVVVYRGRGAGEIRDIRIVRFDGQAWTPPRPVHADGWHFAGCPVNGPAVAAQGPRVWVAWYTEAGGWPELRAAVSQDGGDSFAAPVTLVRGPQLLGRVAVAAADDQLYAAWLEELPEGLQLLRLMRYTADLRRGEMQVVATFPARGRASGMPRMQVADGAAWLVWTEVVDGTPALRGAVAR
ncbi:hypothetical protein [Pseudoxanthomonas sp. GW2]|uniref:hypothetical protein n=1 Tax=Pseudoxanthomonas sp. GW2 TaxID=1211114 RepID=UPI0002FA3AA0|nr:hypothetical protein [Pseudoxanthomonas sp. GW2]